MIAGIAVQMHAAETQYRWNGTVDSDFTNSANWNTTPGVAPYGGTNTDCRINVYNASSASPLYYTAALGHTIYKSTGGRALFITYGGFMHITGGTFESQSKDPDGQSNIGDGTLLIDGGSYLKSSGSTTFLVKFGGTGTGTLTVSNGLFEAGRIQYGNADYTGSGVINLDGGTTRVGRIYVTPSNINGSSTINFNGGLLEANASASDFLEGLSEANVLAGGVMIDTVGNSSILNQNLLDAGGDGGVTKRGTGSLTLGGTNTFTGETVIEAGTLIAANNSALGTTGSSTTVSNGAALELKGDITITGESLQISGKTPANKGALGNNSGDNTWNGNVLIGSNSRISADNGSILRINGVIDDGASNYDVEFRGFGTGVMVVSGVNTYGGKTTVVLATLRLDGGNNRLPTGTHLIIGNSADLEYATFDLNGYDQEVALLDDLGPTMTNSVIDSAGGGTLTVNDSGNRTFDGNFVGPLTLVKTNSNTLTLNGDMQATSVAVNQGTLQGSAAWHCLFNGSDTPNQMIVTESTLDISSMTFDFDENSAIQPGSYVIVDYSAGGTLQANASAPFFAGTVDMPERGSIIHDTVAKQILFNYGMEGTLILVN